MVPPVSIIVRYSRIVRVKSDHRRGRKGKPAFPGSPSFSGVASGLIAASALAFACASYQIRTDSLPVVPAEVAKLQGKSVAVQPVEISFGSSRFAIDLRDLKLTVNGQEVQLQTRFIDEFDDMTLGHVGLLDVNIFAKTKVDAAKLSEFGGDLLVNAMEGKHDYHLPFFKGLGESNMGQLSNRPYSQDRSVNPPEDAYGATTGPATVYSSAVLLAPGQAPEGSDLILKTEISLSNEIVQVISNTSTMTVGSSGMPAKADDYFLSIFGSLLFTLADAKTGQVYVTEKSKSEWSMKPVLVRNIKLPVNKGDAAAFAKYFRTVDLQPYAQEAVQAALESMLPLVDSFYVNTFHSVKVEKK